LQNHSGEYVAGPRGYLPQVFFRRHSKKLASRSSSFCVLAKHTPDFRFLTYDTQVSYCGPAMQKSPFRDFCIAGPRGIEPRPTDLEAVVLPLNYRPEKCVGTLDAQGACFIVGSASARPQGRPISLATTFNALASTPPPYPTHARTRANTGKL
jgi:hypothetical protein